MLRFRSRIPLLAAFCALLAPLLTAQQIPKVSLETSETVFAVMTAINTCGYDQELSVSDPVRMQVRDEVAKAVQSSDRARASVNEMCTFYRDHRQADAARDLAQYISLALYLGEPPAFAPTIKEADLPPDASYVLGLVPHLQRFFINTDLEQIWRRHRNAYDALVERFHEPVAKMLLNTDIYLKNPISGYMGHRFVVVLEPMAGPGQVNARNYATDYYLVIAPDKQQLRIDRIRHMYLHFVLDPITERQGRRLQRLEPLLAAVKQAPMDESFKQDIGLLVNESLIRAIEARTRYNGKSKEADAAREREAQKAATEGFVLTPYFEQRLAEFEKEPSSLKDTYGGWLFQIDVEKERKRANETQFASAAEPEGMQNQPRANLLQEAEQRLASGDIKRAQELAQQALEQKREDPARALFILARVSTQNKDMKAARSYFERTLEIARDARLVAWSHIYLGRIADLQAERDDAVKHYRAALEAGDATPTTKAAAERGLREPYAPPNREPQKEAKEE